MNEQERTQLMCLLIRLLDAQDCISYAERLKLEHPGDNTMAKLLTARTTIKDEIFSFVESLTEK